MGSRMLRRGLPRVTGGEPWPPAAPAPGGALVAETSADEDAAGLTTESAAAAAVAVAGSTPVADTPDVGHGPASDPTSGVSAPETSTPFTGATPSVTLRRGLPRVAGGEPWPPASAAAGPVVAPLPSPPTSRARDLAERTASSREEPVLSPTGGAVDAQPDATPAVATAQRSLATEGAALRRGLPRVKGGEPWPPAGTMRISADVPQRAQEPEPIAASTAVSGAATTDTAVTEPPAVALAGSAAIPASARPDVTTPLPFTRTVWQGRAPRHAAASSSEPSRARPTWPQAISGLIGLAALGLLAVVAVFLTRAFLSVPFMQDFLAAFPGEYEPAVHVESGFAPWVGWQHFFNMFLMVLIIRSGLRVRTEKRPTVFWTPRRDAKGKISLTLWFHQALDLLWMINGVIFVVLLLATGHWARIVPTSWEVLPNALSAALQYISFDWPTENGWNNYNSLQQLAYFLTVFVAAPLAIITGYRMSGLWPKKAEMLSKAYPVEWARALHFPIMLYFVAFIIAHVALVFLTGMLRNLNHMYAAQDTVSWLGFGVFAASMVVVVAGWFAARPLVLAPIAKLFGQVSGR